MHDRTGQAPSNDAEAAPFTIGADPKQGIVRSVLRGFWTIATAETYLAQIGAAVADCRRRHGRLLYVTDARAMPILAADVSDVLARAVVYQPGDRAAVIVDTVLARMGSRRIMTAVYPEAQHEAFLSPEEAEAWIIR